jgi:hypothetical protein
MFRPSRRLVSAGLLAATLVSVSALAACSSADTTLPETFGLTPDAGSSGVTVNVVPADAGTKDAAADAMTAPDATSSDSLGLFDAGPPVEGYAASHPSFPQILNSGGPVLTSPKFVLLSWDGYDYESEVEELAGRIGGSTYWSNVTSEYGIGAGTYVKRVSLGAKSDAHLSYTDAQLKTLLATDVSALPDLGTPDPSTVYIFLVPKTSQVDFQGSTSCQGFAGYHEQTTIGGATIPYAVIGECATFNGLTGIDAVTGTLSHEMIEAVTDPFPDTAPAYQNPSNANLGWSEGASGGELADMCAGDPEAFFKSEEISLDAGAVGSVVLQRSWSNALIATGVDPCVPDLPSAAFFEAMPVVPDVLAVTFSDTAGTFMIDGVDTSSGSRTFELDLFSDRPGSDWTVSGYDLQGAIDNATYMTFRFSGGTSDGGADSSSATGNNGTKLMVTLTPTALGLANPGVYEFGILSEKGTAADGLAHFAWGMVGIGGT